MYSERKELVWSSCSSYIDALAKEEFESTNSSDYDQLRDDIIEQNYYELEEFRRQLIGANLGGKICMIADVGRWNGHVHGYKIVDDVQKIFDSEYDDVEFYINEDGDFCAKANHYDGVNHYVYRLYLPNITDKQIEELHAKIISGESVNNLCEYTNCIGKQINDLLGLEINNI